MAGVAAGGQVPDAQLQVVAVRADQADPALQLIRPGPGQGLAQALGELRAVGGRLAALELAAPPSPAVASLFVLPRWRYTMVAATSSPDTAA